MKHLLARLLDWWEREHHAPATVQWTTQQPKQAVVARRRKP